MVVGYREQRHVARPEQSTTEDALVLHAGAGLPGRFDLGRIGEVTPEKFQVLVVHAMHLVDAEHANAPPSETPAASATGPAATATGPAASELTATTAACAATRPTLGRSAGTTGILSERGGKGLTGHC